MLMLRVLETKVGAIYIYIYIYTYIYIYILWMYLYIYIYYGCICIYIYYGCIYLYIYTNIYIYICICNICVIPSSALLPPPPPLGTPERCVAGFAPHFSDTSIPCHPLPHFFMRAYSSVAFCLRASFQLVSVRQFLLNFLS